MIRICWLLLFMAMFSSISAGETPLQTVASVDIQRYVGKWYEIARYPNRFERNCFSDVTAHYSLLPDGGLQVVNSCKEKGGKINQSTGKAKVVDRNSNAKLKVTFFWPFYGDYWIVDLASDYSYAVVSEPKRQYLWILSRSPRMNATEYDALIERIRLLGFDPSRLINAQPAAQVAAAPSHPLD